MQVLYVRIYTGFLWPRLAQRTGTTFCRSQGIVRPVTFASAIGVCINIPLTLLMVNTFGFVGAPVAQVRF